jgi:hypothetical protein
MMTTQQASASQNATQARRRSALKRVLAIHEARLDRPPTTATSLSNLANVLADRGDLDRARPMYERAPSIRETRLGAEHP